MIGDGNLEEVEKKTPFLVIPFRFHISSSPVLSLPERGGKTRCFGQLPTDGAAYATVYFNAARCVSVLDF